MIRALNASLLLLGMLLGVVLVGCHHVRQLPGAQTVVYASNSVRWLSVLG